MYLWFAIDVNRYYEYLKERVKEIEDIVKYDNTNLSLPYHISLKISFEVDDSIKNDVIQTAEEFYKTLKPFNISVKCIEKYGIICWIRYLNNDYLESISRNLNSLLKEKYDIELHPYDKDFIFHTTLFMDNDVSKIEKSYEMIKDVKLPTNLLTDRYIIGYSLTGKVGSYKVLKEIQVS